MEREVGGVIGKGNTCKSMADSCQCIHQILHWILGTLSYNLKFVLLDYLHPDSPP